MKQYHTDTGNRASFRGISHISPDSHLDDIHSLDLIRKFSDMHEQRMSRDFGIHESYENLKDADRQGADDVDECDDDGTVEVALYTRLSEEMWNVFGKDQRSHELISTTKEMMEIDRKVLKLSRQLLRDCTESQTEDARKVSQEYVGLLNDDLRILGQLINEKEKDPKGCIMSQIRRYNSAIESRQRIIETLKAESIFLDQESAEVSRAHVTQDTYSSLLEKEVEMRTYIDFDYPMEKASLQNLQGKLIREKSVLGEEVDKLQQIHKEFPNLRLISDSIQESSATLCQLETELHDRRCELSKLSNVENTLLDELDALRKIKIELSDTLSLKRDQFLQLKEQSEEKLTHKILNVEESNDKLEQRLSRAQNELKSLRESISQNFGPRILERMQGYSRILFAKQQLQRRV